MAIVDDASRQQSRSEDIEEDRGMPNGTVKFFIAQKGYGFIQPVDGTKDVFVHISDVERAGLPTLIEGQSVAFEIEMERGKAIARDLQTLKFIEDKFNTERTKGHKLYHLLFEISGSASTTESERVFGLSRQQFAETLGLKFDISKNQVEEKTAQAQERASDMVEIIGRVVDWAGGERQAVAWYRSEPLAAFGGRTAEFLVREGRASDVREFLDHVATGGFA